MRSLAGEPAVADGAAQVPNTSEVDAAAADVTVTDTEREFAQFVSQQEPILRTIVVRKLGDVTSDVDDALQEGLIRVWRDFHSWPEDRATRTAYAGRLLQQASMDVLRKRFGRKLQRKGQELRVNFSAVDGWDDMEEVLVQLWYKVHGEVEEPEEFERRWEAFRSMLPALKPIERAVLLAHHPAGRNRKSKEVAERLGITHGQARQHYMEAMAILRPLLSHALAPELEDEEAARVLDYKAGVMTDKRQRGRMKRHLKHCEPCRALADGQEVVIGVGARLFLPLPGLAGLTQIAAGSAAAVPAAVAGAGGGGAAAGGTVLTGLATKAITGVVTLSVAAGGYTAVHERTDARKDKRQAAASPTATPEPSSTPAPTVTPLPPAAQATPEPSPPQATPTPEPTSTATPEPPSGPADPPAQTAAQPAEPAAPRPVSKSKSSAGSSKDFAEEFGP